MKYSDYLKSKSWGEKRKSVLKRADYRCMVCYSDTKLDVHHRTYKRIFKEKLTDLIALCEGCHKLFHNILPKYEDPIISTISFKPIPKNKYEREIEKRQNLLEKITEDGEVIKLLKEIEELRKLDRQERVKNSEACTGNYNYKISKHWQTH